MLEEDAQGEWIKMAKDTPFKKIRIHIIEQPYTPYIEWEIEHYKLINIPLAKEEVYLVDKNRVKNLDIPDGDFVIFDEQRVARNYYDQSGKEYRMDFYDKNDDINKFLLLRSQLLEGASKIETDE